MEGCTMPAVPPMPRTLWGTLGSTPPMGIRQYSSSSIFLQMRNMNIGRQQGLSASACSKRLQAQPSHTSTTVKLPQLIQDTI